MKNDPLTEQFLRKHGDLCAAKTIGTGQKVYYILIATALLFLLKYRWDFFVFAVSAWMIVCYGVSAFLRLAAAAMPFVRRDSVKKSGGKTKCRHSNLPVYTILLPLYRESAVTEKILKRIASLKYPKEKLDVKLLLEQDDAETRHALSACTLPAYCSVIEVPDGPIRTKPRACNYGLVEARGRYCVIYDAEDKPEPDQLKKAVAAFQREDNDGRLLCVQASLNYYNAKQNWLTKFFTVEYSTYFDLTLGGLQAFRLPLPLGGTSNHFKTEELRELGGWDPFNVTEDCDLGIRLYEHGWRTVLLDSTTWEEANSDLWNWVRQRSRWVKGFLQTHLVHYRHPLETVRRLSFRGTLGCYFLVGGSVLMMLMNLVFWPLVALYLALLCHGCLHGETLLSQIVGPHTGETLYRGIAVGAFSLKAWPLIYAGPDENPFLAASSQVFFACSCALFLTNFLLILVHVAACIRRKFYFLIPWALLMPFYWVLISVGAWKGALQLITKPFYWEKTIHGLDCAPKEKDRKTTSLEMSAAIPESAAK